MNQVIVIEKAMLSKHSLIFCPICETNTKHVLSRSGEFYACECGEIIWIETPEEEIEDEQ